MNEMFISNLINIRFKILILKSQTLFFKIIIFFVFYKLFFIFFLIFVYRYFNVWKISFNICFFIIRLYNKFQISSKKHIFR